MTQPNASQNRWLLVLGGNSDTGIACARVFAQHGFNIMLAGRRLDDLKTQALELSTRHAVQTQTAHFDARLLETHRDFYNALQPRPDVVLCAVGVDGDQKRAQRDTTLLRETIEANFLGPASILSIVANDFEARGSGAIIAISSMAGERGKRRNYVYGAAKAGLTAFLSGLRHRLNGKGILVTTVLPGFLATKMTAGIKSPAWLTLSADAAAARIYNAYAKRRAVTTLSLRWAIVRAIIRNLPERIFLKTDL